MVVGGRSLLVVGGRSLVVVGGRSLLVRPEHFGFLQTFVLFYAAVSRPVGGKGQRFLSVFLPESVSL